LEGSGLGISQPAHRKTSAAIWPELKAQNMKRFLLIFVSVALLIVAGHAADALYHNIGTVI